MAQSENAVLDQLLKVQDVAEITGMAVGTLNRGRVHGGNFPPFVKIGKSVRYRYLSVLNWVAGQQEHNTTSEIDANNGIAAYKEKKNDR